MNTLMRCCLLSAVLLLCAAPAASAEPSRAAEAYPTRPIRLIVTFAPGASNDILARLIGSKLTEAWGQNVIVDNRPGAGGSIGAATVAKAAPDGYTLLLANSGPSVGNPLLTRHAGYSPNDFTPIIFIGYAPLVILANPSFAPRNPKELVDYARGNPGKVSWGSSGTGTSPHIAILLFEAATGTRVTHIPYKGAAANMADLLAGQIDVIYTTTVSSEPQIKANRVRGIAVASAQRVKLLPNVPTLAEYGIKNAEARIWYGLQGPLKMPPGVVAKLNAEVNKALQMPDVRVRLDQLGFEIAGGSSADFDAVVKEEIRRIQGFIKAGLLKTE
jgi:tripartite-type tricarboxylate transporter receptor subunit TctC